HGYQSLAQLIALAQSMGLITIMDAKRGDIGSTSLAYARAYLSPQNDMGDNPFCCDWLTVNPLMGEDCLQPFIDIAKQYKKGIFVLLETSNPGAKMILKSVLNTGETVNQKIVSFIQKVHNELALAPQEFGPVGGVIGATNADASHWRRALPQSVFLMPGIGAQGGHWATVQSALTSEGAGVFVPISRGITTVHNGTHSLTDFTSQVQNNLRAILVNQPVEWRTGDA
ncbi:MAG: orotidine-5'-phosphate decarboxylase, partial [Candidatus Marinamargulisbacteria bacterium]